MSHPRSALLLLVVALALPPRVAAHVGSPDVFVDGQAGPYRLFITVRPPRVVPGVADIEVLAASDALREVRIVPLPLTGPGAAFAPSANIATRSRADPRLFTGQLWMMTAGAWQVRVTATGDRGSATLSVPVPTLPQATRTMTRGLAGMLAGFMVLLGAGAISIVAAAVREAPLAPGERVGPAARRRGRIAFGAATVTMFAIVALGNWWWSAEASRYGRYVYKPLSATPSIGADGSLRLQLHDPGWIRTRRLDDFIPDHGHEMHLFLLSPLLDRLWHLHPEQTDARVFTERLPRIPAGEYELFADVVHATGVSETITAHLRTTAIDGGPLEGDDSAWTLPSDGRGPDDTIAPLPNGGRILWLRDSHPLQIGRLTMFTFRIEDGSGQPARDLELYMGMPAHALFIRRDRAVFAHVHPSGSAPMAALDLAASMLGAAPGAPTALAHLHPERAVSAAVTFPYGIPAPGEYRIFVQVKRSGRIETAAFDAHVAG